MASKGFKPILIGNYEFDQVASALQKMIRRGMEYEAVFWSYVLHASGYGSYLWRRLIIILSEDIGSGDPQAALIVHALHQNWECLHKHNKQPELYKFFPVVHAVLYLCRCKKSREDDSLLNLIHERFTDGERLPVLDIALDVHTQLGRKTWGRMNNLSDGKEQKRWDQWFAEWAQIANPAYSDPWEQDFKNHIYGKIKKFEEENAKK